MRIFSIILFLLVMANPLGYARDDVGGPFTLINQDKQIVTEQDFKGNPALIYFGFATCPDVCPSDLEKISWLAQKLKTQSGQAITPIFITLDPERDTAERLKAYLGWFNTEIVGLTGTLEEVTRVADSYHVYFKKAFYGDEGEYLIDHSTMLFLVDEHGKYLAHYGRKVERDDLYHRVSKKLGLDG